MIISASRRTDIPALQSDWFLERIREGYVDVKNPFNTRQSRRIYLNPDIIDCIVFWTRNPNPLTRRLSELDDFNYYFTITITPYGKDLEPINPTLDKTIEAFIALSEKIGRERTIWRYDPILISPEYPVSFHLDNFSKMAEILGIHTEKCVISFIDIYKKLITKLEEPEVRELSISEINEIAHGFSIIAKEQNLTMASCAEEYNLEKFGITKNKCIDDELVSRISGKDIRIKKDKNQRPACGCVESVDIGEYRTCGYACLYCYAN
jgi:hypothetical protein